MGWVHVWEGMPLLLNGFLYTIALALAGVAASTVLGFVVYLLRAAHIPGLNIVLKVYFEVFRGTPVLVQILFIYFGAAFVGIYGMPVFVALLTAITLHQATHISEIFRSGFEAVPTGQREAARSLSLSRFTITKDVVLPQAMRVAMPPLFGQYINLLKNTALASTIGAADVVRQGQGLIDRFGNPFEVYLVIAALYFAISYPLSLLVTHLEKRTQIS
jgi:polar amino acid transport system permease protein